MPINQLLSPELLTGLALLLAAGLALALASMALGGRPVDR